MREGVAGGRHVRTYFIACNTRFGREKLAEKVRFCFQRKTYTYRFMHHEIDIRNIIIIAMAIITIISVRYNNIINFTNGRSYYGIAAVYHSAYYTLYTVICISIDVRIHINFILYNIIMI